MIIKLPENHSIKFPVVALDPGETTGWCRINYSEGEWFISSGVFSWPSEFLRLESIICDEYGTLVVEDFKIYPNKVPNLSPVEVIGVVKFFKEASFYHDFYFDKVVFQMASVAKQLFPDKGPEANKHLKKVLGKYYPKNVHTRDTFRHALYYIQQEMKK